MQLHVCGKCGVEFETEEDYAGHVCEETGFSPIEPDHLGSHFARISEEALKRGEERKEAEHEGAIEGEIV